MQMTTGAKLIALERERQFLREGYSAFHDMQHDKGELVKAAICYARFGGLRTASWFPDPLISWPWNREYWKPGGVGYEARLRCLVKAGALIAAAIDRLIDARERAKRRESRGGERLVSETGYERIKCPHCGELFEWEDLRGWNPIPGKIPSHTIPGTAQVCPGVGGEPRNLHDRRPLWIEEQQ